MGQYLNNGIENIEYNVLNLPELITFANGGTIRYTYSATGEKIRAKYTMTSDSIIKRTDYCANVIYQDGNYPKGEEKFKAISNIEIEAYKMQYSYDKSFPGYINSINDINIQSVGNIKKENGEFVYQEINTLYMNELEQKRNNKKLGF